MTTPAPTPLPRSRPEDEGVPPAALDALLTRWAAAGVEAHGLTVLRRGRVVAEATWAPYRANGAQLVYSVSKTLTGCAAGLAVAEGVISLEDRLVDLFPEAADVAGPRAARLTLHHVLSMSTGHREDTLDWLMADGDFPRHFLSREPEEEPGSWFVYHNGATLMAALAVQRRTGERLLDHLRPRLLEPLGVEVSARPRSDGLDIGYSGMHLGTEGIARLGELLRLDGVWAGRRLLPGGWVARMTGTQVRTSNQPATADWGLGYGYQVWRSQRDGFRADGAWGQFALVCPDAEVVLAVTSCSTDTQALLDAVWEELLDALADDPLPRDDAVHARLLERLGAAALPPAASAVAPDGAGPWTFVHEPDEDHPALRSLRVEATGTAHAPWRLVVDDGTELVLAAGDGSWADSDGPFSASAGWSAPGVLEARVAATATPHVLHLRGERGILTARWNGRPLGWAGLRGLRAPGR